MCGLFGFAGTSTNSSVVDILSRIASHNQRRGSDSSGAFLQYGGNGDHCRITRADSDFRKLWPELETSNCITFVGHTRLVTHGHQDNQPIRRGDVVVFHNGIVTNTDSVWAELGQEPILAIDTEVIAAAAAKVLDDGEDFLQIPKRILDSCHGSISCIIVFPKLGQLVLFSNTGSLWVGKKDEVSFFSSEAYPLQLEGMESVTQVRDPIWFDIPPSSSEVKEIDIRKSRVSLVPARSRTNAEQNVLDLARRDLARCTRCVLPETMPYIDFDSAGVCNYCRAHGSLAPTRPATSLEELAEEIRQSRSAGPNLIFPFSGGRDSSFGLHFAKEVLGLTPIAYTYDWGMVSDVGRRNISHMCAKLGVEHIVVAADIQKKRRNIRLNLEAWLRKPHLGMLNLMMAGDKHFFRHVETVKRETGINYAFWSTNPFEATHFKSGFLNIRPNLEERAVYATGWKSQLIYQSKRWAQFALNPAYLNVSLWDTLSGEYYRSLKKSSGNYKLFDYLQWDEKEIDSFIDDSGWEREKDSNRSWRIGDGTASFYNYVYARVAGFTENDTFRSNQIREGVMSREAALNLVSAENEPDYPGVKWYLDTLDLPFRTTIDLINEIPLLGAKESKT